jgi:hypothetical protein
MLGKEKIVVREVADEGRIGLLKGSVPMRFASPQSLGQIEETHAPVAEKRLERRSAVVLDTVADDDYLDLDPSLGEGAADGERKQRGVAMRRYEDRRVDHGTARIAMTSVRECIPTQRG